jgi:acyl-CoA synthetase (AMP-forming)/AMP-acid ligase II
VNPGEVEAELLRSGLVSAAVAYPRATGSGDNEIHVALVPAADTFTRAAMAEYCARELPAYQCPAAFHVFGALPKTGSGKIDRAAVARGHADAAGERREDAR